MNKRDYQHYALDSHDELTEIKDGRDGETYRCPYCRHEMIMKRGKVRQWHYAHKVNHEDCSYDKYLHTLAERMISDWFNRQEAIFLTLDTTARCDRKGQCPFHSEESCRKIEQVRFDLKQYYPDCILERGFNGFVADIFCNNKKLQSAPIFIEICVTHKCTEEKINSGIRIIEFVIQSEEDILNIINSAEIQEGEKVRLYNFKPKETSSDKVERHFQKFMVFASGKCHLERYDCTCRTYRKGVYEISVADDLDLPFWYDMGAAKAYADGVLQKNCQLCFFRGESSYGTICKKYKKCGKPQFCSDNDATQCQEFSVNRAFVRRELAKFEDYSKSHPVDIWRLPSEQANK